MPAPDNTAPATFPMYCCECSAPAGSTECEITATSFIMCEDCHQEYIRSL